MITIRSDIRPDRISGKTDWPDIRPPDIRPIQYPVQPYCEAILLAPEIHCIVRSGYLESET